MNWKHIVRERLPRLEVSAARETEIIEELAQLLEDRYTASREEGCDEAAALAHALQKFPSGGELAAQIFAAERPLAARMPPPARAESWEPRMVATRRGRMFHDFLQDLRFGMRTLRRSPGFALIAILTLALGIGANSAIFSVVNAVMLRGLPYEHADRLVTIWETTPKGTASVAHPNFLDWRAQSKSFEDLAAWGRDTLTLTGSESAERVGVEMVDDAYFRVLGLRAAHGRVFTREELASPMQAPVALLGHGLWQRRFAGTPDALGKQVVVNGAAFTIVGILPQNFRGYFGESELWLPFSMRDAIWPQLARFNFMADRNVHWHRALGRLKPGVSLEQARTELNGIAARLGEAFPTTNAGRGVDLAYTQERLTAGIRPALLVLLGTVAMVLLIACANLANLLLVRLTARQREIAVRLAIGAGKARLARQLVTESVLLALLGGGAGLLLANWGLGALVAMLPITPQFAQITLDGTVFAFTLALCLLTGTLTGLLPVLQALRPELSGALKEGTAASGTRSRVRGAFVSAEIAIALVLLIAAGLMLQSFRRMLADDPGFRPEQLAMLRFEVPESRYRGIQRSQLTEAVRERIRALPGVESAGLTYADPFAWEGVGFSVRAEGVEIDPRDSVLGHQVSPEFFRTLRIPLLAGREFAPRDSMNAPQVAIVNAAFAEKIFQTTKVLGRRISIGSPQDPGPWLEIVGVVGNTKVRSLRENADQRPLVYTPLLQSRVIINLCLLVRSERQPQTVMALLRDEFRKLDPQIPLYDLTTMIERMHTDAHDTRSYALLISLFAVLAAALAAVGIYGVMAHVVGQRTREIGLRMALGARPATVLAMVLREGALLATVGIVLGMGGALAASRLLRTLVFGVATTDVTTYALAACALLAIALVGCAVPAARAARLDPLIALRHE